MGIVIEVQQGMVNRGASISPLSQYPHECEILFGPLTGIEVLGTRIDGSLVVVECAFSINLSALTLEEVLGKRRKVVRDMCEQLAARARLVAEGEAWAVLTRTNGDWRRRRDQRRLLPTAFRSWRPTPRRSASASGRTNPASGARF